MTHVNVPDANAPEGGSPMPPTKLAHVVFQTNRMTEMQQWYCTVLGGRVVYENAHLSFVTYDDEHHRVAFVDFGPLAPRNLEGGELRFRPTDQPGLHHVAFTFGAMGELLDTYGRLEAQGIRPFFCVNHGPTTSMYYTDPDGNRIELQIDNFATAEEGQAWMHSPAFDRNPIGVEFDPEELVRKFRAGVPVAELVIRD
jgi:catechol-2,3-dioxygenase